MKRIGIATTGAIAGLVAWMRWRNRWAADKASRVTAEYGSGWSCGSCSVRGEGPPPTFTRPRRCRACQADVFPNGLYRSQDNNVTRDGILLMNVSYPRVHVHLDAEIPESGDLVLSGQDLGPAAAVMGGDDEYEYWVTVDRTQLPKLAASLLREAKRDEQATLKSYHIPEASSESPARSFRAGRVSVQLSDLNRLTLLLLRDKYTDGTFSGTTDFTEWCSEHNIAYGGAAF